MRKRDLVLQVVAMILAFGVGILLGARGCGVQTEPEVITETVVRTAPPKIVYECPPEPEPEPLEASKEVAAGERPIEVANGRKLPDAPPPITPRQRQRLLAWVRDQSADLEGCRTAQKDTFRLTVTLKLDDEGAVQKVQINAAKGELPGNVRRCLRERMVGWVPPAEFVEDRPSLVFGLTL